MEVQQRMRRNERVSFPGGSRELDYFERATSQTTADLELQARAQLAAARLRELVSDDVGAVTHLDVAVYYARHRMSYYVPERRVVEITNRKTRREAERVVSEAQAGGSIISPRQRRFKEGVMTVGSALGIRRTPLERTVYAATPGVITGPIKMRVDYVVLRVRSLMRARRRQLSEVEGAIRKQLQERRRELVLASFVKAFAQKWIAKTDCAKGYITQKCRQYDGRIVPEEPLSPA